MDSRIKNNLSIVLPVALLVLSIIFVWLVDLSLSKTIASIGLIKLKSQSEQGLGRIGLEVQRLTEALAVAQERIAASEAQRYPDLQDLKRLSRSHGLALRQME